MSDLFTLETTLFRHIESRVSDVMADTRIVALVGPRQSGKTMLARKIAEEREMNFITLDDEQSRQFALDDPSGFMQPPNSENF